MFDVAEAIKEMQEAADKKVEEPSLRERRDELAAKYRSIFYDECNMSTNDYARALENMCGLYFSLTEDMLKECEESVKPNTSQLKALEELAEINQRLGLYSDQNYDRMLLGKK